MVVGKWNIIWSFFRGLWEGFVRIIKGIFLSKWWGLG
jgi:hypothetical protein